MMPKSGISHFYRRERIGVGDHVRIGFSISIRGGDLVSLGRYSELIRMNEINSIPEPDAVNAVNRASR